MAQSRFGIKIPEKEKEDLLKALLISNKNPRIFTYSMNYVIKCRGFGSIKSFLKSKNVQPLSYELKLSDNYDLFYPKKQRIVIYSEIIISIDCGNLCFEDLSVDIYNPLESGFEKFMENDLTIKGIK